MLKIQPNGRTLARVRANGVDWTASFDLRDDAAVWLAVAQKAAKAQQEKPDPAEYGGHSNGATASHERPRGTLGGLLDLTYRSRWAGQADGERALQRATRVVHELGPSRMVAALTEGDIDAAALALEQAGLGPSTVNKHLAALNGLLTTAKRHRLIEHVPDVSYRRAPEGRKRFLTFDEERRMIEALDHIDPVQARIVELLIDTGIRTPSEVQAIRVEDVLVSDAGRHGLRVHTAKGGRERVVPLTDRALAAIRTLAGDRSSGPLVEAKPARTKLAWDKARKRIGLEKDSDFVPYACRHTFGTRHACIYRTPLPVLQRLMGHSTIKRTAEYVVVVDEDLWAAIPPTRYAD
jgi:integrase